MTTLLYLANARIPTEKAHGLQIMQNCEALAEAGAAVTLWAARRVNTPALRRVANPWAFYGVARNFALWRVPCLDLQAWADQDSRLLRKGSFFLQYATYLLALSVLLPFRRADLYYSRDLPTVLLLSLLKPRARIAYEPHRLSGSGLGRRLQTMAFRRAGNVFPITQPMAEEIIRRGTEAAHVTVAHDGIRRARFDHAPDQTQARESLGWPQEAFIVGYVGQLHTMSMDKGLGVLIEALARAGGMSLGLVGGPESMAEALHQQWCAAGLPEADFRYAGQVTPEEVPRCLSAFDVCAMPHPYTEHFARATSPLKLFEYMASGRAIVASDLPGWADVLRDGDNALLVPAGDAAALAEALRCLRDQPDLRQRLSAQAYEQVMSRYTWERRAVMILDRCAGSGG